MHPAAASRKRSRVVDDEDDSIETSFREQQHESDVEQSEHSDVNPPRDPGSPLFVDEDIYERTVSVALSPVNLLTTPHRSRKPGANGSPTASRSPQKLQKVGFSEPIQHPTRQPPYKRPKFRSTNNELPFPSSFIENPGMAILSGAYDLDEGAAGISSEPSSDDSALQKRLAVESGSPSSPIELSNTNEASETSEANEANEANESSRGLQNARKNINYGADDAFNTIDGSVVPDSQPESISVEPARVEPSQVKLNASRDEQPATQTNQKYVNVEGPLVPQDTVLNTTSEALINFSPPSNITAATQESSSQSMEKLIRWLEHREGFRVYTLLDFLEKQCQLSTSVIPSQPHLLKETLSTYIIGHKSQVDGPNMMPTRHKELANASLSTERFLSGILNELRMRQRNTQVETEIIYGPWSELSKTAGRLIIVFILLHCSVYRLVGDAQWFQVSGEVPKYQSSRSPSSSLYQVPYVTKRDIVFRDFLSSQSLRLPPMTPIMLRLFPSELQELISIVENRARPMKFLFDCAGINKNGWTPRKRVTKFLSLCVKKVFPRAILGSPSNDQALNSTIRRFVNMPATGRMPLGQAAHGIKLKDMHWTQPIANTKDEAKKSEILLLFWDWLFNHFLKPMLAHHFYMTEMSGVTGSLFYYELSVWGKKFKAPGVRAFVDHHGGKDKIVNGSDGERLRFVPKASGGVRPIVNLREFNKTLRSAHVVLQSFPKSKTRLESWQSWFLPLHAFKAQHDLPPGGKYYTVKLDISGCYDNMKISKLEQVVRKHLSDGQMEFWLQTHSIFDSRSGLIKDRPLATSASDMYAAAETNKALLPIDPTRRSSQPPLLFFSKINGNLRGARLPPEKRMLYGFPYSGTDVLEDLSRLVRGLFIRLKHSKLVPFNTGIPQGSSCSLDLCNILLDDLVHTKLKRFIDDPRCLLLRYVDDFLFVSTSKEIAESYLATMLKGFNEEYGVFCKEEKQQSNLGPRKVRMEYLGYEFDPDTLEVYPRRTNESASGAPVPLYKSVTIQRMHVKLETILGLLRSYQRAGIPAPKTLEKKVSRAFGKFVAENFEACSAFSKERAVTAVFHKLVRMKLLPLVCTDHRTSMLNAARNMFLIQIDKKRK